jgi:hypothetical protein
MTVNGNNGKHAVGEDFTLCLMKYYVTNTRLIFFRKNKICYVIFYHNRIFFYQMLKIFFFIKYLLINLSHTLLFHHQTIAL